MRAQGDGRLQIGQTLLDQMAPLASDRLLAHQLDGVGLRRVPIRGQGLLIAADHLLQHVGGGDPRQVGAARRGRQGQAEPDQVVGGVADHRLVEIADLDVDGSAGNRRWGRGCPHGSRRRSRWPGPRAGGGAAPPSTTRRTARWSRAHRHGRNGPSSRRGGGAGSPGAVEARDSCRPCRSSAPPRLMGKRSAWHKVAAAPRSVDFWPLRPHRTASSAASLGLRRGEI